MQTPVFTKNNQSFECLFCKEMVQKHSTSSRDHCNHCLKGLHVDINPGDRLNPCKGELDPIALKIKNGKQQIVYKCLKCNNTCANILASDDNQALIIELSTKGYID